MHIESLGSMINHPRLARYINEIMGAKDTFLELGIGKCALMGILEKQYERPTVGVEKNVERATFGKNSGFNVIHSNVLEVHPILQKYSDSFFAHAGFSLLNIFCEEEITKLFGQLYVSGNVSSLLFEVQSKPFFLEKYKPGNAYRSQFGELILQSTNHPFSDQLGNGVYLDIKILTRKERVVSQSTQKLYSHEKERIIELVKEGGFRVESIFNWSIRENSESSMAHNYYLARRGSD